MDFIYNHFFKFRNSKIQLGTGVFLNLLPSVLVLIGFIKTGVAALGLVFIAGNLVSEWKEPVIRPFLNNIFGKGSTETDVQKL